MELIVLGKTNDDKGTQLEQLTKSLLERLGYKEIVLNDIGPGGQEIDLRAEILIPSLQGEQQRRVICECKAHRTPIGLTDWLKFIGKVHVEEIRLQREITGCFIALSGVNGSVAGSFDELRQHRQSIELITGEHLVGLLQKVFDFAPLDVVTENYRSSLHANS